MNIEQVEAYEKLFPQGSIIDGVINSEVYFNSKFKIAWFLKEPYSSEEEGYHIRKYYSDGEKSNWEFFKKIAKPTWHPIIYTTYGILNNFMKWDDIPYIRYKNEMCDVINNIAIINANKYPSKTGTFTLYKNLSEGYSEFETIIHEQIKTLQPQIHIFCSTFYLYKKYFELTDEHIVNENPRIMEKDNNLFLNVYHPANRTSKREVYINEIIDAVQDWSIRNA